MTCIGGIAQRNELLVGSLARYRVGLDGADCGCGTGQESCSHSQITVMTELTNSGVWYVHHAKYTEIKTHY